MSGMHGSMTDGVGVHPVQEKYMCAVLLQTMLIGLMEGSLICQTRYGSLCRVNAGAST